MHGAMTAAGIFLVLAGAARAQAYGQTGDNPCRPAPQNYAGGSAYGMGAASGAIGLLTHMMTDPQRARDCTALRQAQWAEYNAKQKAAKDKADADAAADKQAAAAAETAKAAAAAQQASAHDAAVQRRAEAAAAKRRARSAAREEEARAQQAEDAEAAKSRRAAEVARRLAYVRLVAAENAPDNMCRQAKVARVVMDGWNGLITFSDAGVKVIDIEHVTTLAWHPEDKSFACHGVFVTNKGWRVAGTTVLKRNIAGDKLFQWQRDARQDLAEYEAPPMQASSPEVESGVSVGGAVPGLSEAVAKGADGRM